MSQSTNRLPTVARHKVVDGVVTIRIHEEDGHSVPFRHGWDDHAQGKWLSNKTCSVWVRWLTCSVWVRWLTCSVWVRWLCIAGWPG